MWLSVGLPPGCACASVSQAMHQADTSARGLRLTRSFRKERQLEFDWDVRVPISTRCRAALAFMRRALLVRGSSGCRRAASLAHPFDNNAGYLLRQAGLRRECHRHSLDVDLQGWCMAARLAPGPPTLRAGRSWADTLPWCLSDWMAPLPVEGDADRMVACTLSPQLSPSPPNTPPTSSSAASCSSEAPAPTATESLHGLRYDDFRRPAAQDGALLLGAACLDLGLDPPLFVPRPAPVTALATRPARHGPELEWDTSSSSPRELLAELASSVGASLSLDVFMFASAHSTLAPRYFAAESDPRAEGLDAFAQPHWGSSLCPVCHSRQQEFIALAPPHSSVGPGPPQGSMG